MNTRVCGETGLLVEVDDLAAVLALTAAARELPDVLDVVPGAVTVLLVVHPGTDLAALGRAVRALRPEPVSAAHGSTTEIQVVYDGDDLPDVADATGLTVDAVIGAHTATPWRVAFGGFAPGFAYLVDGDPRLSVPRRAEPRTRVPAGSVGLAGAFSGVYPRPSPGGWQLIGHTDATLFDVGVDPPALLQPGGRVRFVAG